MAEPIEQWAIVELMGYVRLAGKLSEDRGTYLHEFTPEQHGQLAAELRRFKKARVVVSYYADPRLAELYPGWTLVDCSRQKHLHVQNARGMGRKEAPEVLLLNGPSFAAPKPGRNGIGQETPLSLLED